jgi:hypothetical protein
MNWLVSSRAKPRDKDRTRGARGLLRREASRLYDIVYARNITETGSGLFKQPIVSN